MIIRLIACHSRQYVEAPHLRLAGELVDIDDAHVRAERDVMFGGS
jgi:hypothetical protein